MEEEVLNTAQKVRRKAMHEAFDQSRMKAYAAWKGPNGVEVKFQIDNISARAVDDSFDMVIELTPMESRPADIEPPRPDAIAIDGEEAPLTEVQKKEEETRS